MANELHTLSIGGTNYPIRPFKMTTEGDNRSVSTAPSDYVNEFIFKGLKYNNKIGSPSSATYSYLFGLRGWSENSGGNAHEIAFNDNGLYRRQGASTEWGAWAQILDSSNYTSYLNIAPVLKYHGITTTALTDNATTSPIVINGSNHTPEIGCTVFYEDKEFVWNGAKWEEFGYPFALNVANTTTLGGVKPWFYNSTPSLGSAVADAKNGVLVSPRTTTVARYYGVEMDVNGRMYVNVPWISYTAGTGISISSDNVITAEAATPMIEVTYGELKALRDNAELTAGQQYRITDYVTSTSQENTVSAGHQFDIIVTADSENALNEKARACLHEGDTYFASSDLSAWEIWYCLDNDTSRFTWADGASGESIIGTIKPASGVNASGTYTYDVPISKIVFNSTTYNLEIGVRTMIQSGPPTHVTKTDDYTLVVEEVSSGYIAAYSGISVYGIVSHVGTGVIYRMIDERRNDCPYDFKNIMFKHPKDKTTYPDYYYTFTTLVSDIVSDHSLNNSYCHSNIIKEYTTLITSGKFVVSLNNIVFINTAPTSSCYNNSFGNNCNNNSFGNSCNNNSFGDNCYYNSFGNNCSSNSFGNSCHHISFRYGASTTGTLLDYCQYNNFDDGCSYNIIWNASQTTSSNKLQNIKVDKSAASTSVSYVYYNVATLNSTETIFISKEYKTTSSTSSIPIGLYNTSNAVNNKLYSTNVTVTPSKSCVNAAGGFYETSDERLKNFSDDVMIDLEKLSSLRKKYFTWKDGHGDQQLGVSAQEVQVLYPELVNEGDDGNLSVDYAKLSVVALSAVDKLYNKQKDLEDKLAKIEKALNL